MPRPSVVAVYGTLAGGDRPRRLGSGRLRMERVVLLDPPLEEALSTQDPPEVLRVGIASLLDGEPFVEVIEVRQVLRSANHTPGRWAVELMTPAVSPTIVESMVGDEDGIKNAICFLFPDFSFC